MNETRQRFGDVATKLQAALALKDVFIQVVSSEQSGRFTKVTAKMSRSDIKWLIENKFTIPKEIGSDSIRVVESDDGVVSIEVGLPFERVLWLWKGRNRRYVFAGHIRKDVERRNCHPRSCAVAASADRWPVGFRQVGVPEFSYLFARSDPFPRTTAIRPNGPQESRVRDICEVATSVFAYCPRTGTGRNDLKTRRIRDGYAVGVVWRERMPQHCGLQQRE